jgi:hypothetical protein
LAVLVAAFLGQCSPARAQEHSEAVPIQAPCNELVLFTQGRLAEGLACRAHAEYVEGENLLDMIKEDLVAERIAIGSYREMIEYIGDKGATTKRISSVSTSRNAPGGA